MVSCVFELLCEKPEEEENLLVLLVNKVGDLDKKIASKATHLLSQLLVKHPMMKNIVIAEVERLLFRPNISERAKYYAITFLNQIVLIKTQDDVKTANALIHLYFTLFNALVKSIKAKEEKVEAPSKKKNRKRDKKVGGKPVENTEPKLVEVDSLNSKMMAALLTGVNRAFPFSKLEDAIFDSHIDMLFVVSHLATFNTSIQALTLIFQVQNSRESLSDRFYRSLYDTLFDHRLYEASKQAMYLNLLYRALKADISIERVKAFIKRLIQSNSHSQIPLLCGSLFLISELCNQKPGIWGMVEGEDLDQDDVKGTGYDGRKRDPLYANAGKTSLWELSPFVSHFHPTVALYASTILSGKPIEVPQDATNYDPLLNHTMTRFLDRFVYKAPKKVKSLHHGTSLMQPRSSNNLLLSGGRKKQNAIYDDEDEGDSKALDDAPVNQAVWGSATVVPVDEVFFYEYFKDRKRPEIIEKEEDNLSDADSQAGDLEEDDIWKAMQRSVGFDKAGLGPGELDDEDVEFGSDDEFDLEQGEDDDIEGSEVEDFQPEEMEMEDWVENPTGTNESLGDDDDGEFEDIEDEIGMIEEGNMKDIEDDEAFIDQDEEFASLFQDEFSEEENEEVEEKKKPNKKSKQVDKFSLLATKLGYKGDYFQSKTKLDEFASADDFSALLDIESEQEQDELDVGRPRKRKSLSSSQQSKKRR
jgi:ribosome biogenesis protein MAK21